MAALHNLYLSLGSNLGDRESLIQRAIALIDERVGVVYRVSSLHETEPWGYESENKFLNACCLVRTMLLPHRCLDELQCIERELGREEKSSEGEYHDRLIDIDMLLFDDVQLSDDRLTLPHPHMHERDFVMVPLREIMGKE